MSETEFVVYILLCSDGSLYTGSATDVASRVEAHRLGLDPTSYTHSRRPVRLVWTGVFESWEAALTWERQVKGWSRAKKLALIEGDWEGIQRLASSKGRRGGGP